MLTQVLHNKAHLCLDKQSVNELVEQAKAFRNSDSVLDKMFNAKFITTGFLLLEYTDQYTDGDTLKGATFMFSLMNKFVQNNQEEFDWLFWLLNEIEQLDDAGDEFLKHLFNSNIDANARVRERIKHDCHAWYVLIDTCYLRVGQAFARGMWVTLHFIYEAEFWALADHWPEVIEHKDLISA